MSGSTFSAHKFIVTGGGAECGGLETRLTSYHC
jgi:hypothetical protein